MEQREHRRKSKRYPVQWKAAVVFDKSAGKPVLHTQTDDLSTGGAAIHSEYADLTGSAVTLLLAQPPRQGGEQPRMLKVRAQVVSSLQKPGKSVYRHGLSFVRSADDGLDALEELLNASSESGPVAGAAAQPSTGQPAAAAAAATPAAPAGGSRLAQLKQLAQAKSTEEKKPDPKEDFKQRVSEALQRAFEYLKELTEQLNILKPAFAGKGYQIIGVPEFAGLAWEDSRVDSRNWSANVYEQVGLYFRISGKKQLRVVRDYPASDKLKQQLTDNKIEFQMSEKRDERGSLQSTTFGFPCEVKASLVLEGKFETGKLLLKMRNVERFGMLEYLISPEAVTQEALEELAGFILGEIGQITLLRKNA